MNRCTNKKIYLHLKNNVIIVDIAKDILLFSTKLKQAYKYYQKLLYAYHKKQADVFFQLLREIPKEVPTELQNIKKLL